MLGLVERYRPLVARLKAGGALRVVDSHVHAADVLNVVGLSGYSQSADDRRWRVSGASPPRLGRVDALARLRYTRLRRGVEAVAFARMPRMVVSTVKRAFAEIGPARLEDERAVSGVDAVVLLTLPPTSAIDDVYPIYGARPDVHYLGSVDVHGISPDAVPAELARQKREHGIVGIKLHPNLQGFLPVPEDNPEPLARTLHEVYRTAAELGLYVLLHGGRSHFLPPALQSAGHAQVRERARSDCALLERYGNRSGESRLFERYRCPFVLAHLACMGVARPDWSRLAAMIHRYPHLFVDTCGVWSGHIARAVELLGAERVIFGSDGLYNLQLLELVSCLQGVEQGSRGDRFEENAALVLGDNFARLAQRP